VREIKIHTHTKQKANLWRHTTLNTLLQKFGWIRHSAHNSAVSNGYYIVLRLTMHGFIPPLPHTSPWHRD
jgi:hypothetical protein